jgi:excisionase family DNA binding protein
MLNENKIPIRYISLSKAAKLLDVHPRTIARWCRAGFLKGVRLPGGHYRIELNEIDRIVTQVAVGDKGDYL